MEIPLGDGGAALVTPLGIYAKDDYAVLGIGLKPREHDILNLATVYNLGHILIKGLTLLISLGGYPHRDILHQELLTAKLLNLSLFVDYTQIVHVVIIGRYREAHRASRRIVNLNLETITWSNGRRLLGLLARHTKRHKYNA